MAALLAVTACKPSLAVDPPPPAVVADAPDTLPALAPSIVEAPVVYDLEPALAVLERAVPRSFGDITQRREVPGQARRHFAFAAERSPFVVKVSGRTVTLETVVSYQGKGWYDPPLAPEMSGSCGTDGERPRARVRITTTLQLERSWRLRSRSAVDAVEPYSPFDVDQCRVTVLKLNVTERVMGAVRPVLEQQLAGLDGRIAALDVRPRVEGWWRALARPIRLADSVWLEIQPRAVRLGAIDGDAEQVVAIVALAAQPRITTGPRPPQEVSAQLPPLSRAPLAGETDASSRPEGLHGLLEATLDYGVASGILTKKLRGRRVERGGHAIVLRELRLSGIGGGKVALAVRVRGALRGQVYLTGTPQYDTATAQLYVPDLDFDAGSLNLLVDGLDRLRGREMRDVLREQARWPVGPLLEQARARMERGMNRRIAEGVRLVATVHEGRVLGVRATRDALLLRARADGRVQLLVDRAPRLRGRRVAGARDPTRRDSARRDAGRERRR